jgi:hypothetical protein
MKLWTISLRSRVSVGGDSMEKVMKIFAGTCEVLNILEELIPQ